MCDSPYAVTPGEPFVYGISGEDLLFIPVRQALDKVLCVFALEWSDTWGDLLNRLPHHRRAMVIENWQADNNTNALPPEHAPLSDRDRRRIFNQWVEESPLSQMLDWLPQELLATFFVKRFGPEAVAAALKGEEVDTAGHDQVAPENARLGHIEDSFACGENLILPADREREIVALFERFGVTCVRQDALVEWAEYELSPKLARSGPDGGTDAGGPDDAPRPAG